MRPLCSVLCVPAFVLALAVAAIPAEKSVDEVLAFIEEKFNAFDTMTADYTMKMDTDALKMTQHGKIFTRKPDLMRLELDMDMGQSKITTLMVNDGTTMWVEQRVAGRIMTVMKMDAQVIKQLQQQNPMGSMSVGTDAFAKADEIKELFDVTSLGMDRIGRRDVHVLQLVMKEDVAAKASARIGAVPPEMIDVFRIFVDAETGVLRSLKILDKQGSPFADMTFSNYKLNPEINPARFAYAPPEGVNAVDITPRIREMLKPSAQENAEPEE